MYLPIIDDKNWLKFYLNSELTIASETETLANKNHWLKRNEEMAYLI